MADAFKLTVPADGRYRGLAPLVAAKYAEVVGGAPADGQALADAVTEAMTALLHGPGDHATAEFDLAFHVHAHTIEVTLHCGPRSQVVTRAIAAHHR